MAQPTILEVVPGSPAAAIGVCEGDELLAINGAVPTDVIEYQQLVDEADLALDVRRDGRRLRLTVTKREGAPLGLRLNASIFDRVQTCDNHCEFCFIYQLPPGMRESLYLKDDDYRLSFLYGNFTTLTRFTEIDLARILEERLGPLYVSIHATDPVVRTRMLRNRRGATSLRWLRALLENGVEIHGQIVLCPGINNRDVLDRTCAEVVARYPRLASVGIVPLGLSQFNREPDLVAHTASAAAADLEIVHSWQEFALARIGTRLFFASDELYLRAGWQVPESSAYESFPQHENGIGMIRAFHDELDHMELDEPDTGPIMTGEWRSVPSAPDEGYRAVRHQEPDPEPARSGPVVLITGEYGAAALSPLQERLETLCKRPIRLLPVHNRFFGGNIAVSGLLVGEDVRRALYQDEEPAGMYLLPDVALSGDIFLDETPLARVAAEAKAPLLAVEATAGALIATARR